MMLVQKEETGFQEHVSDKYGFRNSNDAYRADIIDVVLTGDSYTAGWDAKPNENISAVLTKEGFHVINLGKGGNGPLVEYAALKEYAISFKPKIVLWVYFENDLEGDLLYEMESTLLKRYLTEDNFSQNLISRQQEIDQALMKYVESQLDIASREKFATKSAIKLLKLRNLRTMVHLTPEQFIDEDDPEPPLNVRLYRSRLSIPISSPLSVDLQTTFKKTLEKATELVSSWNGRMYFVYLPSGVTVVDQQQHPWRQFSLNTATGLGIPIIDIENEVFSTHDDPASLFPFRNKAAHYNAKGYRLAAEAITKRLRADGVLQ
jgi:hypothetical protein